MYINHIIYSPIKLTREKAFDRLDLALNISHSLVEEIEPGAFEGMGWLRWLDLRYNEITKIKSGTFKGLHKLQYLVLVANRITEIEEGAFEGLFELKSLFIALNSLSEVSLKKIEKELPSGNISYEIPNAPGKAPIYYDAK
jgi:Leucine-rich repeat (LRR) protein